MNNEDGNQNNSKRRPTRVELYSTPKPGKEKRKRSFFNRRPKQTTPNHKHKTVSPSKRRDPYGISRRMFKVILGCLLVILITTIAVFLVKQQDPVNVDSNDITISTSTSSRKKHKKSDSSSHKHRSSSSDSDDNDTRDTYSISTLSRSDNTPQPSHPTNQQPTANSSSTPQQDQPSQGEHHDQGNDQQQSTSQPASSNSGPQPNQGSQNTSSQSSPQPVQPHSQDNQH